MIRNPDAELLTVATYVRGAYPTAAYLHVEFIPEDAGAASIVEIFDAARERLDGGPDAEFDEWHEISRELTLVGTTHGVLHSTGERQGCWMIALPTAATSAYRVHSALLTSLAKAYTSPERPHAFEARSDRHRNAVVSAGVMTLAPHIDAQTAAEQLCTTLRLITGDNSVYVHVVPRDDPDMPDWSDCGVAEDA